MIEPLQEEYRSLGKPYEQHQVSNLGNVRRKLKNGEYRLIAGSVQQTYLRVCLSSKHVVSNFTVHQLVASAFLGDRPIDCPVIDHIDRNRLNNNASNLRYTTYRENKKNSDTFKGYISERFTKDDTRFRADIRRDGDRYKKTFKTREEAEQWVDSEEYTDAIKTAKQGEGHIHVYKAVNGDNKYRAMIRLETKLYTKVCETEEEAKAWIKSTHDNEERPVSTRRPLGKGGITERKTKKGEQRFDAVIKIDGKKQGKTFMTKEEAENWLDSFISQLGCRNGRLF